MVQCTKNKNNWALDKYNSSFIQCISKSMDNTTLIKKGEKSQFYFLSAKGAEGGGQGFADMSAKFFLLTPSLTYYLI